MNYIRTKTLNVVSRATFFCHCTFIGVGIDFTVHETRCEFLSRVRSIPQCIYIRTVSLQLLLNYVGLDSFPSQVILGRNQMYCACCSAQIQPKNQFELNQQSRKRAPRANFPNIYTVPRSYHIDACCLAAIKSSVLRLTPNGKRGTK